jgi:hypothetical protein
MRIKVGALVAAGILSVPALWSAAYYFHVLPEPAWFYEFRSWPGVELLAGCVGLAGGIAAALLPRAILVVPLLGALGVAALPHVKPLMAPIPDEDFRGTWVRDVCMQSTPSTCGPASVATILRGFGTDVTEEQVARRAYTYVGGTEAWYLARFVRSQGLTAEFRFRDGFDPDMAFPAVVGVRRGHVGHFIPILEVSNGIAQVADPLDGAESMTVAELLGAYDFTGFYMCIDRG